MSKYVMNRLDNDFYNFTMGQIVWRHYPDAIVTYKLTNRSDIKLGQIDLEQLQSEIDSVRAMSFSSVEKEYLNRLNIFSSKYIDWLTSEDHILPPVNIAIVDGDLEITYTGQWKNAIFWETPLLAIVNGLGNKMRGVHTTAIGHINLTEKITKLKENPHVKFMEFGTRRRASASWQGIVISELREHVPNQLLGTSNVHYARTFKLKPMGTMAHQLFMVSAALWSNTAFYTGSVPLQKSQERIVELFEKEYEVNPEMWIMLPDTFTTKFALSKFNVATAKKWAGFRQDSGDPFEVVQNIIDWYLANEIDPATKRIIPSDSLDIDTAISLEKQFGEFTHMSFGIGTNLTNDIGVKPLSIVIKPVSVRQPLTDIELPCVKLSDDPYKATGEPEAVAKTRKMVSQ